MVLVYQAHQSPMEYDGTLESLSLLPVDTSMVSHPNQSVAMNMASFNQGNTSSPVHPSSAVQNGPAGGEVPTVHQPIEYDETLDSLSLLASYNQGNAGSPVHPSSDVQSGPAGGGVPTVHQPIDYYGTLESLSLLPDGTSMVRHPNQSIAMNVASFDQGNASSPLHPSSAVQSGHANGGVPTVHQPIDYSGVLKSLSLFPGGMPMVSHPNQSVAMNVASFNQGNASSPVHPSSAVQNGPAGGGVPAVPQRSQRPPGCHDTPPVMIGTPSAQRMTPVDESTPTSYMGHAGPSNPIAHTPVSRPHHIAAEPSMSSASDVANEYLRQVFGLGPSQNVQDHLMQQCLQPQPQQQQLQSPCPNPSTSPDRLRVANAQRPKGSKGHKKNQSVRNHHRRTNGHHAASANGISTMQPPKPQRHVHQAPISKKRDAMVMSQLHQVQHGHFKSRLDLLRGLHAGHPIPEQAISDAKVEATFVGDKWLSAHNQRAPTQKLGVVSESAHLKPSSEAWMHGGQDFLGVEGVFDGRFEDLFE